ncbi:hypothetical protein AURDEDRAFT_115593 [Auricularia subglabra TFB-10046 SS5]|nr:hypothetical protein AURDEDRAFT_115593 [Auricularia subglabra TFB-10046 SS5]
MEYSVPSNAPVAVPPPPPFAASPAGMLAAAYPTDYQFPPTPAHGPAQTQIDVEGDIGSIERSIRFARHSLQQHRVAECRRSLLEAQALLAQVLAVIPVSPLAHAHPQPMAGPSRLALTDEPRYGATSQKRRVDDQQPGQRVEKALKFNGYAPPDGHLHPAFADGPPADIKLTLPGSSVQSYPDPNPPSAMPVSYADSPDVAMYAEVAPPQPFPPFGAPTPPGAHYASNPGPGSVQTSPSFAQAMAHMPMFAPPPAPASSADSQSPIDTKPTPPAASEPASSPPATTTTTSATATGTLNPNDLPPDLRLAIDEIFFSFVDGVCSNLDATDPKGEAIHQTLMAKKMQRLDESPDYRPFRFRIQAFTNGFLDLLAKRGYPEDKLPTKKVRHYLWTHPYISRYNEEGKKTKSKGNHIWSVEARRVQSHETRAPTEPGGGVWTFRKFERRIAGSPPGVAYVGVRWAWAPRVWDPQAPRVGGEVTWSSPPEGLLGWLKWKGGEICGVPREGDQGGEVVVRAHFVHDGKDVHLEHKFTLQVAPMGADVGGSPTGARPRRPTLDNARRILSEPAVPSRRTVRRASIAEIPSTPSGVDQVTQVVAATAKRVSLAQRTAGNPGALAALVKQEQVLLAAAAPAASANLVQAAQEVVLAAAHHLQAEKAPGEGVMVNEVILATQAAVAQAVLLSSDRASEVDVMRTAGALQHQVPAGAFGVAVALPPNAINGLGVPVTMGMGPMPPPAQIPSMPPPLPPDGLLGMDMVVAQDPNMMLPPPLPPPPQQQDYVVQQSPTDYGVQQSPTMAPGEYPQQMPMPPMHRHLHGPLM